MLTNAYASRTSRIASILEECWRIPESTSRSGESVQVSREDVDVNTTFKTNLPLASSKSLFPGTPDQRFVQLQLSFFLINIPLCSQGN